MLFSSRHSTSSAQVCQVHGAPGFHHIMCVADSTQQQPCDLPEVLHSGQQWASHLPTSLRWLPDGRHCQRAASKVCPATREQHLGGGQAHVTWWWSNWPDCERHCKPSCSGYQPGQHLVRPHWDSITFNDFCLTWSNNGANTLCTGLQQAQSAVQSQVRLCQEAAYTCNKLKHSL